MYTADTQKKQRAARVALSTWLGMMLGMIAKIVIAFMMLGIFLIALWV